MARLVAFLKSVKGLSRHKQKIVAAVLQMVETGVIPQGDWLALTERTAKSWKELERVLDLQTAPRLSN